MVDDDDVVEAPASGRSASAAVVPRAALRRRAGADAGAGTGTGAAATYEATAADGGRPRPRLKRHAPRVAVVTFDASRVGDLIGPRGEHLREIEDETGADIDARTVSGEATIFADSMRQCSAARKLVLDIVGEIRVGDEVRGTVTDARDYGCVVRFLAREKASAQERVPGLAAVSGGVNRGRRHAFRAIGVDAVLGVVKLSRRRRMLAPVPAASRSHLVPFSYTLVVFHSFTAPSSGRTAICGTARSRRSTASRQKRGAPLRRVPRPVKGSAWRFHGGADGRPFVSW